MGGAELVAGAKSHRNRSWRPPPRRAPSMPRPGTFSAKGRFDGHASSESRAPGGYGAAALRRRVDDAARARHDGHGAAGLIAIFLVDLVSLLYISWLKRPA